MSTLQEILLWSTYLASAACHVIFALCSSDFKQQILNGFYFCVAIGGVFRWK